MLQDPVNSLRALGPVLELLGAASGYKINELKSATISMNIPVEWRDQMKAFTSAPWVEYVMYLRNRLAGFTDVQILRDRNVKPLSIFARRQLEEISVVLVWTNSGFENEAVP